MRLRQQAIKSKSAAKVKVLVWASASNANGFSGRSSFVRSRVPTFDPFTVLTLLVGEKRKR